MQRLQLALIALFVLGCQSTGSRSDLTAPLRARLREAPTASTEPARAYGLYREAWRLPATALIEVEDDVVDVLERDGLRPIASFLALYVERLEHARPLGYEETLNRVHEARSAAGPIRISSTGTRTFGLLRRTFPMRTQVVTADAMNFFFCASQTDLGKAMLSAGHGAAGLVTAGSLVAQHCVNVEDLRAGRIRGTGIQGLAGMHEELTSGCLGECDDDDRGNGSLSDGHLGLEDLLFSCGLDEKDAQEAKAVEILETRRRCEAADTGSPGEGLMGGTDPATNDGGTEAPDAVDTDLEKEKQRLVGEVKEFGFLTQAEKEAVIIAIDEGDVGIMDAVRDVLGSELSAFEAYARVILQGDKSQEAKDALAQAEAGLNQAGQQLVDRAWKLRGSPGNGPRKVKELGPTKNPFGLQSDVDSWLKPVRPECLPEHERAMLEAFHIDAGGFRTDPLVAYFVETPPGEGWMMSGCDASMFAAGGANTLCGGFVIPCPPVQPPPDDPCACAVQDPAVMLAAQQMLFEQFAHVEAVTLMNCPEGTHATASGCVPDQPMQGGPAPVPKPAAFFDLMP